MALSPVATAREKARLCCPVPSEQIFHETGIAEKKFASSGCSGRSAFSRRFRRGPRRKFRRAGAPAMAHV
jgi:hypothetical protein